MMRLLLFVLTLLPTWALAQNSAGWGNAAQTEKAWSWTDPLAPGFWMAWTYPTAGIFIFIFSCMAIITIIEIKRPGGAERKGVLGLVTTRGDRLFISLLGTVYIFLAWLGIMGQPLWWPLGLSIAWGVFCFTKV